ncbi:MAG TPA: zinc transporter ZupT [Allocoleopsis sp.]
MEFSTILLAFSLTLFAGLSTAIGSIIAISTKHTNIRFLSLALGLSAGVMVYVSFVEMFPTAITTLQNIYGIKTGLWIAVGAFFAGIAMIAIVDLLIPKEDNPHEMVPIAEMENHKCKKLHRVGLFTALAIAVHNFPEGLATFVATMQSPALGVAIAIAIAIHNIPEGIAVAVPIYHATKSKMKAFWYSFLSGLAEPVGALVGFFLLQKFFSDLTFGIIFALIAGIMVYISIDELLPAAEEYGEHHLTIIGFIIGMAIMAVSLVLLVP